MTFITIFSNNYIYNFLVLIFIDMFKKNSSKKEAVPISTNNNKCTFKHKFSLFLNIMI